VYHIQWKPFDYDGFGEVDYKEIVYLNQNWENPEPDLQIIPQQGYKFIMNPNLHASKEIIVKGTYPDIADTPIQLRALKSNGDYNDNWIGYYKHNTVSVFDAFSNVINNLHFIVPKDFKGETLTGIWIGPDHQCKTKLAINRQISMPVWLMNDISAYIKSDRYKARKQLYFMSTGDLDAPVFLNKNGSPFTVQSLNTLWSKLRKAIQENSNPHFKHKQQDCRATFGAYKLESLLKIEGLTVMQALVMLKNEMGHKDLETTMRYLRHYEGNPEKNQIPEITTDLLEGAL
jgi:hypothetical protein